MANMLSIPIKDRPTREPARGRWVQLKNHPDNPQLVGAVGIIFEMPRSFHLEGDEDIHVGALIHLTDEPKGQTVAETVCHFEDLEILWPDDPRVPADRRMAAPT